MGGFDVIENILVMLFGYVLINMENEWDKCCNNGFFRYVYFKLNILNIVLRKVLMDEVFGILYCKMDIG